MGVRRSAPPRGTPRPPASGCATGGAGSTLVAVARSGTKAPAKAASNIPVRTMSSLVQMRIEALFALPYPNCEAGSFPRSHGGCPIFNRSARLDRDSPYYGINSSFSAEAIALIQALATTGAAGCLKRGLENSCAGRRETSEMLTSGVAPSLPLRSPSGLPESSRSAYCAAVVLPPLCRCMRKDIEGAVFREPSKTIRYRKDQFFVWKLTSNSESVGAPSWA